MRKRAERAQGAAEKRVRERESVCMLHADGPNKQITSSATSPALGPLGLASLDEAWVTPKIAICTQTAGMRTIRPF